MYRCPAWTESSHPSLVGRIIAATDSESFPVPLCTTAVVFTPGASSPPAGFCAVEAPTAVNSSLSPEISPPSAIACSDVLAASPSVNIRTSWGWAATSSGVK
ncbi:MAG: hypothetical protein P8Y65_01610 [Campylobacterales bacterium]